MARTSKLFARMHEDTKEGRQLRRAYEAGAAAAAEWADSYNSSTTHEYRLGDCILGKMNIRKGKPRKNASPPTSPLRLVRGLLALIAEDRRRATEREAASLKRQHVRLRKFIATARRSRRRTVRRA